MQNVGEIVIMVESIILVTALVNANFDLAQAFTLFLEYNAKLINSVAKVVEAAVSLADAL